MTSIGSLAPPAPPLRLAASASRLRSSEIRDLLNITEAPEILSLAGGLPAPEALPTERIRIAALRALEAPGRYGPLALQYGPTEGVDALRELVAHGTLASPPLGDASNVIITTGSQQGLELVARALVDGGDTVVVEDDPYHALSFAGSSPASLARHAPDHTVTLGSASKVVAPGLRVGWLHSPPWLHGPMVRAKQTLDLHTAALPQLIALDVLADEAFLRAHLTSARALYRTRASALHAAVSDFIDAPVPAGGMFLWGRALVDTRAAFAPAIAAGVAYVPGDAFTVDRDGSEHLRLSFATLAMDDLRIAADRLRTVLIGAAPGR